MRPSFINNEIMSPSMPNITQIINSKSIAYFVISNMPRKKVDFEVTNSKTETNVIDKPRFSIHQFIAKEAIPVVI
jgi:hypothetical protein